MNFACEFMSLPDSVGSDFWGWGVGGGARGGRWVGEKGVGVGVGGWVCQKQHQTHIFKIIN